ncbi:MAG TPA: YdeI/OmpD-associated family protein [Bacteroidia bacterium]|nr:YdeI/OmpD-associated family protein [Bacteroidia bacterium]
MNEPITFDALLVPAGDGGGVYAEIPFSVEEVYGIKGQLKVKATIDGVPYRGSLANMGGGCHVLGVLKAIREKIGKQVGDTVHITLERDTEERVVEIPEKLQELLDNNPTYKAFFDSLSYTNRKEYARWIAKAKREETLQSRLQQTLEKLMKGKKNPTEK